MKLSFHGERIIAVVGHPDDVEMLCAGTLARARRDGAALAICALCQGNKGQPSKRIKNLAATRRLEMSKSAALLGAQVFHGTTSDSALIDTVEKRMELVEIFRQFQPTLVLAHDPNDYHPDHRAASAIAEAASWICASLGHATHSASMKNHPAIWWMDTIDMSGFTPGFYVDISGFVALKCKMLACHQSQLSRSKDPNFGPLMDVMRMQYSARGIQSGVEAAEAFRAHTVFKRGRAW